MKALSELPFEMVSYSLVALTESMIAEFGIYKTVQAIQSLYDADHLTEEEANAMLDIVNDMRLHYIIGYDDFWRESFNPITLR